MNLNTATIIGNLTRDPEPKALPSGMTVVSLSVATNRVYKDRDGKKQEEATYHNVIAFGKTADNVAQFLRKGSQILVIGRLQTRSWDKDGQKQYRTEIVAETVQFGSRPAPGNTSAGPQRSKQEEDALDYPEEEINPDDIPF